MNSKPAIDFDETMSILVNNHILNAPDGQASVGIKYVKMVAKRNMEKK